MLTTSIYHKPTFQFSKTFNWNGDNLSDHVYGPTCQHSNGSASRPFAPVWNMSNQEQDLFPRNKAIPLGKPNPLTLLLFNMPADFDLLAFANVLTNYNELHCKHKHKAKEHLRMASGVFSYISDWDSYLCALVRENWTPDVNGAAFHIPRFSVTADSCSQSPELSLWCPGLQMQPPQVTLNSNH